MSATRLCSMGSPKLSILCPSLLCRVQGPAMIAEIQRQAQGQPVEFIVLADGGEMSIGEKHNRLLGMARGEYVAFVADDDLVSDDYVSTLLATIIDDTDVVT